MQYTGKQKEIPFFYLQTVLWMWEQMICWFVCMYFYSAWEKVRITLDPSLNLFGNSKIKDKINLSKYGLVVMILISDKCTVRVWDLCKMEAWAFYSLVISCLRITSGSNLYSVYSALFPGISGISNCHLQHICLCTSKGLSFQRWQILYTNLKNNKLCVAFIFKSVYRMIFANNYLSHPLCF